jgi:plastocyanin
MKGLVAMLVLWVGGIGGGFVLAGHEPRLNNFLTSSSAGGTTTSATATATTGANGVSLIVKMKDFSFDPNRITVPAGKVTLKLQNYGRYTHDLRIHTPSGGTLAESGRVGAGFEHDFTITLTPGTYNFDCSVSNHAKRGMTGVLTVTG